MCLHRPTRAAYSWRPGFIYFPPLGRIQRRDNEAIAFQAARFLQNLQASGIILVSDINSKTQLKKNLKLGVEYIVIFATESLAIYVQLI
jgi:hypothetical protein